MAKEKPKTQETEEQTSIRKEIRKDWSSMEPKLIEMAHMLYGRRRTSFGSS